MSTPNVSFERLKTQLSSGSAEAGRIYFDSVSKTIKLGLASGATEEYGVNADAIKSAIDAAAEETDKKIAAKIASVYRVKGSVDNIAALKALEDVVIGDVWNVKVGGEISDQVIGDGANVVATTSATSGASVVWDALGADLDLSPIKCDDEAVAHQFVTKVTQADGKISVTRAALEVDDLPSAFVNRISVIEGAYVNKTTTVNGKALSGNVTLTGEDITVGGSGDNGSKSIQEVLDGISDVVSNLSGNAVTSFGGETGDITVDTDTTVAKKVKFSMVENKLTGEVQGLADTATKPYSEIESAINTAKEQACTYADGLADNYATADQGALADSAIQTVNGDNAYIETEKTGTTVTVRAKMQALGTASTSANGLAAAYDVVTYVEEQIQAALAWEEFE